MPANRSHTSRHARRLVRRILPLLRARQRGENPVNLPTLVRSALWLLVRQEIPPYRRIIQEVESEYNRMNREEEMARANERESVTLGVEPSEQDVSDTDSEDLPDYSFLFSRVSTASSPPSQPTPPQPSLPLSSLNSVSPPTSTPRTPSSPSSSISYQAASSLPLSASSPSSPSSSYQATLSLPRSTSSSSFAQQAVSSLLLPTPPPEEQVSSELSVPHRESSSAEPSSGPLTQEPLEECTICAYRTVAVALECGHRFCGHCPAHWQGFRGGHLICPYCRAESTSQTMLPWARQEDVVPLQTPDLSGLPDLLPIRRRREDYDPEVWSVESDSGMPFSLMERRPDRRQWEPVEGTERMVRCPYCGACVRNTPFRRYVHHQRCTYTL